MFGSDAALRAFVAVWPGSHSPAWAVESSSDVYLTVKSPALLFAWSSASLMPLTIGLVCALDAPWSGRLE